MSSSPRDKTLPLHSGRRLGYAEYGDAAGRPVLFLHGAPGSRRSIFGDMDEAAARHGLRLIAVERPGYGLSDPRPDRTMRDWSTDVQALTNVLGIERFGVLGFSMGSIYALACAQSLPAQVERVAIVGGLAPLHAAGVTAGMADAARGLYDLARTDAQALRAALAPLAASPGGLLAAMAGLAPPVDQNLLAAAAPSFEADFAETLRHGIAGVADDFMLAANPWPFPLEEVRAPTDLWIGTEDRNTPLPMSRYLASVLPQSQLHELPGAGHFCLYTHWADILDRLAS